MFFLMLGWGLLTIIIVHCFFIIIFNIFINPHEPSTFAKIFPYQFINNLLFKGTNTEKSYFSIRVDINTSEENVREHDEGVRRLIHIADRYHIPITFSIATEYISVMSDDVIQKIKEGGHDVISHGHMHTDMTEQDQVSSIRRSKDILEEVFEREIIGLIGPNGKHDTRTLEAAKTTGIKFLSSGALSHIRYWSFPYPFKKDGVWLLGGSIKSDFQLYRVDKVEPKRSMELWKKAISYRTDKGWYTQLEYHNFSTTDDELSALEELFKYIKEDTPLKPITQSDLVWMMEKCNKNKVS